MKRIDLDDLPPKIAALLSGAEAGEEVLLVQAGAVVGRLVAEGAAAAGEPQPPVDPDERAKEIFELFRSSVEDEF
jgi:antitoxin (DNA-binding transcriptional repressor) of toxin-antitoxin stability system